MAGIVLLAVWLGAASATAGGAWLVAGRRRRDGEATEADDETTTAQTRARTDRIDRRTALAAVAAAAIGFEAGGRYVGDPTAGAALAAGVGTGGLLAVAVPTGPDREALRSRAVALRSVGLSDLPQPSAPSLPDGSLFGGDVDQSEDAPLPATPEQVTDDADEAEEADETTAETAESTDDPSTGLRPDPGDDPEPSIETPTTVSLEDGAPSERPDGPVLFADGAGSGEECRNCGTTDAGVRQTRVATVPDRESDTVALCDDCRIAVAAREDDPEDCTKVARRVQHVGGDDGRCDNCGYIGRLSAHAVVPLSDAGKPHRGNAVALCETCHDAAHGVGSLTEDEPTP